MEAVKQHDNMVKIYSRLVSDSLTKATGDQMKRSYLQKNDGFLCLNIVGNICDNVSQLNKVYKKHPVVIFVISYRFSTFSRMTQSEALNKRVVHLELIRLLDDDLQPAVLSQNGLPHLSYPASLLLLRAHLPLRPLCEKKGGGRKKERRREGKKERRREGEVKEIMRRPAASVERI